MALNIPFADHLLPPSASDAEKSVASIAKRISDVPAPIEIVPRPLDTPADFLPFVAWQESVDIWFGTWSKARKRAVTDASLKLHFKKGTVYAYREYLRYVDARVLRVERPPSRVFAGDGMSKAERERWLAGLPQVRVWLIREGVSSTNLKAFHGGHHRGHFAELAFPVPSTALQRMRRRARFVVDGVETETRVTEFGSFFRLHRRSMAGLRVFGGRPMVGACFLASTAWRRLVTIQPAARLPWRSAVGPSLATVTSEPERVKVPGTIGPRVFSDTCRPGFFLPSTAKMRIFDRFAVHDGSRALRRPGTFFMGGSRFGFPAHTLILTVSIPGRRTRWMAGDGIVLPRSRFWVASDARQRVERARRAVQAAARGTDKVLLKIGPPRRFVAGQPFIAGVDRLIVGFPN